MVTVVLLTKFSCIVFLLLHGLVDFLLRAHVIVRAHFMEHQVLIGILNLFGSCILNKSSIFLFFF